MTTYRRPQQDPHDWAAVSRWEDAARPPVDDVPVEPECRTVFCVDEQHGLCDGIVHVAREGQLFADAELRPCTCDCHRAEQQRPRRADPIELDREEGDE